jgi:hypothetical protein
MRTPISITLGLYASLPAQKAIPHTPDGHPDLQGVWTNATITPLERSATLAGKTTLTDVEAKAYEQKYSQSNTLDSHVHSGFNLATGGSGVGAPIRQKTFTRYLGIQSGIGKEIPWWSKQPISRTFG